MNENIRETLQHLPAQPGIYLMKDSDGKIIYIGKAISLRSRVRSYFNGEKDLKTTILVRKINSIDYILTQTEQEALVLENNLIKEHSPRYNINLKDGKTYPVIRITAEDYPRVFRTRRVIPDGSHYFGPYPDLESLDRYLELIEEYFPLRKCSGPLKKRPSPCLYYHIGRCTGPCAGLTTKEEYQAVVQDVQSLLEGRVDDLVEHLKLEMSQASERLAFEKAARVRDAIKAVQAINQVQQVQDFDPESRDYIAWEHKEDKICFVVFKMRGGKLLGSDNFRTSSLSPDDEILNQFLLQYYGLDNRPPQYLYVMEREPDQSVLDLLNTFAENNLVDRDVSSVSEAGSLEPSASEPDLSKNQTFFKKLEAKRDTAIMNMAAENARQLMRRWDIELGDTRGLKDLQVLLDLPTIPMRIEGFDIAQLHGKHTVAAMVSFWKGIPDKNHYRIFGIKSLGGEIDDYESIREAVARRYTRVLNEELEKPDLIVIDGGKGQLNAAKNILDALGLDSIPICSLAKQEEEVFLPNRSESVRLPIGSPALRILQFIRDEAHRFGTSRNQNLRSSDLRLQRLEAVPGIGPTRAKQLLTEFGSIEAITEADVQSLHLRGKLPLQLAQALFDSLDPSKTERHWLDAARRSEEDSETLAAEIQREYDIDEARANT